MAGVDQRHVLTGHRQAAAAAAIPLALAGAAWLLYGSVLRLWWTYDDFYVLRNLLTHRPLWYLFDAAAIRRFSGGILTPLFSFSMDLDRRLFGIDPRSFYLHHLAAFSLCPAALYGALRLWLRRPWAAAGAWVFLIGPAAASLAPLLFVRHYVEAILLATLSLLAWGAAVRRGRGVAAWRWAGLSAVLWFAACMTKEIAVPLPAILPLLPAPRDAPPLGFQQRLRLALPHVAAGILYLAIRYAVLGTLFGGYGFLATTSGWSALALALPAKVAAELAGGRVSTSAALFGAALAAGISALLLLRRLRAAALSGLALLLALLLVLPVSTRMEPRYAVPAWIVVCVAFAAGCQALAAGESPAGRRLAGALALAAGLSGLWLNREDWSSRFARAERMSAEDRFLLDMKQGDVLRHPLNVAASLKELAWMKERVYHRPAGAGWFQDDLYLCVHRGSLGRVWGYDDASRRVVDLTAQVPALRARHCSAIRGAAPLRGSFRFTGEDLYWNLGPYADGPYRFVLADGVEAYDMPRQAGFKVGRIEVLPLRIEYASPAGWTTYSPELRLREGSSLRWERP